jgi:hypothetical protein
MNSITALELGKWLLILGAALTLWLKIERFKKTLLGQGEKREISPSPLPVKVEEPFARQQEIQHIWKELSEIKADMLEMKRAAEMRAENIFRRINDVSAATDLKIDAIPMKVIDILDKTGAIQK